MIGGVEIPALEKASTEHGEVFVAHDLCSDGEARIGRDGCPADDACNHRSIASTRHREASERHAAHPGEGPQPLGEGRVKGRGII